MSPLAVSQGAIGPEPGLIDSERFELRRELGAGGFGRVFSAWDKEHGQLVALKLLHKNEPMALRRFKSEFRSLANLAHRNLVGLFELHQPEQESKSWFFTMELVDGAPFTDWVRPAAAAGSSEGSRRALSQPSVVMTRPARPLAVRSTRPEVGVTLDAAAVGAPADPPAEADTHTSGAFGHGLAGAPVTEGQRALATPGDEACDATPAAEEVPLAARGSSHATPLALPQPFFGIEAPDVATLASWEATRPAPGTGTPFWGQVARDHDEVPQEERRRQEQRLRETFRQLVEALAWLHASGHLHRDVKPSNVLVDARGIVKLVDFGLVTRLFSPPSGGADGLGEAELIVGTPAFMAPELCAGLSASPASDLYSVGVMLYIALTGHLPFGGDSPALVLAKQALVPRPPSELAPVPSQLEELCLALLAINPVERPDASAVIEALGAPGGSAGESAGGMWAAPRSSVFVGRREEVARLALLLGDTNQAARGCVALVSAASGYGKTTLVEHVLRELSARAERPPLVLRSRCFERGSVRYRALDGAIDELASRLFALTPSARAELVPDGLDGRSLRRLFPVLELGERSGRGREARGPTEETSEPPEPVDLVDVRRRAFGALRELFQHLTRSGPVVVAIDDAQWADEDSVGLLAELMRVSGVRWVITYRPDEAEQSPFLRALRAEVLPGFQGAVETLELAPLGTDEALALALESIAALDSRDELLAARVAEEAGGHPLLIAELAHAAVRRTTVSGDERRSTLDELLAARIGGLPASTRVALELISVAGEPVPTKLVRAATGVDQRDFNQLYQEHLALARASAQGELVMCWHDRVRETSMAGLDDERLARRHLMVVETAERLSVGDASFLHTHWMGALPLWAGVGATGEGLGLSRREALHRVFVHGREAIERARSSFAFDRAVSMLRACLTLGERDAEAGAAMAGALGSGLEVRLTLAQALVDAGRGVEAARCFEEAARLSPDGSEGRRLELRAAEQYLFAGAFGEGEAVIRRVLARAGLEVAQGVPGAMASFMWESLRMRFRGLEFVARPENAVSAEQLSLVDTLWSGTIGLSMAWPLGSQAFQQRHLRVALDCGEPFRVARALSIELAFSGLPGGADDRKSRALSERAHAVARTIAHPYPEAFVTMSDGGTHWLRGRWKAARGAVERALAVYRRDCAGVTWEKDTAEFVALSAMAHMGELVELGPRLDEALADAVERGDLYLEVQLRTRFLPLMALARGEPGEARQGLEQALSRWKASGFQVVHYWGHLNRVMSLLYEGRVEEARAELEARRKAVKRSFLLMGQYYRVQYDELRARVALAGAASGARRPDWATIASCRKKLFGEEMGWSTPMAELIAGYEALLGSPKARVKGAARAREALSRAREGFERADMALHALAARRLIARSIGDEGALLDVDGALSRLSVRAPERFMAMFGPTLG